MKGTFRILMVIFFIVGLAVTVFAAEEEKQLKVGFIIPQLTNPYWNTQAEGAKEKAKEYNIELIIRDSQDDPTREIDAVETWITQGVDGIIVATLDPKAAVAYAKRAKEKGIPVVAAIHPLEGADAWLSLEEYKFGYMAGLEAGKWIRDELNGEAEFAVLAADFLEHLIDRSNGIVDGIQEMAPKAKVVFRQDAYTPELGMDVTEAMLQAHPNIKVIQGINDGGALGAYEAVRSAGKDTPDFYIGGNDATQEALVKIKEGGIYRCSVDISPYESGQLEIEMIYKLIQGEEIEKVHLVPMIPVTIENVDEYLKKYEK